MLHVCMHGARLQHPSTGFIEHNFSFDICEAESMMI